MHNWSPLTVTAANNHAKNVILVDTTKTLVSMALVPSPYANTSAVKVGSGVTIENLLTFLEENGLGMYASPAVGRVTVGGVLAVGGHGTSVPAVGEKEPPGYSYGTMSDLVISLTAVVWDRATKSYVLKTFKRSDTDIAAFLVNLGRTFITDVTFIVGPNYNLRCQSFMDIPSSELFAAPENVRRNSRTFSRYLDETGRIETILFPFSTNPWLKKWSIITKQPSSKFSRKVNRPYNYIFTNTIPKQLSNLIGNVTNEASFLAKILGPAESVLSTIGNLAFLTSDIWGQSKNLLLYVKESTVRQVECGFAVITKRSNTQKLVSQVTYFYNQLLSEYSKIGLYPINGVIEIRATALDRPFGVVPDGDAPLLSTTRQVKDRPDLDTAIWFCILSFDGAKHQAEAFQRIENFFYKKIANVDNVVRVEWSKGYGYSKQGPWTNKRIVGGLLQSKFSASVDDDVWNVAVSTFNKYDPHRIFSNDYLNQLLAKVK